VDAEACVKDTVEETCVEDAVEEVVDEVVEEDAVEEAVDVSQPQRSSLIGQILVGGLESEL
jgi:hypothetical protein